MFVGEYSHNLDEKNRLMIPSKLREELTGYFIITKGLDGCLAIYSKLEWEKLTTKLETLSSTKKDVRNFLRIFMSGASIVEFDKQGRIVIPSNLKEYASLEKECILIGAFNRIEVWSDKKWQQFNEENKDQFEIMAEHLFDGESGE